MDSFSSIRKQNPKSNLSGCIYQVVQPKRSTIQSNVCWDNIPTPAIEMSSTLSSHFHQTRKGKILQVVSELYVRHDLGLGFTVPTHVSMKHNSLEVHAQSSAQRISDAAMLRSLLVEPSFMNTNDVDLVTRRKKKTRLVILDTNVLLHNLDIIEHQSFVISNIVIPQTALAECRNRSYAAYGRVIDLFRSGERRNRCVIFFPDRHCAQIHRGSSVSPTPNDQNDEIIRNVAEFYGREMVGSGVEIVLLTDDNKCREIALQEQKTVNFMDDSLFIPRSVRQHVTELEKEDPNLSLSDIVAQFSSFTVGSMSDVQPFYPPHLSPNDISFGIKSGRYFQGVIRAERGCYNRCYVTVKRGDDRVAISIIDHTDINRAIDGDVVAIEIHPLELWSTAADSPSIVSSTDNSKEDTVGIPPETAEPNVCDEENVMDSVEIECSDMTSRTESVLKRPNGKVVGIIRRNFRQNYCGSIYSVNDETVNESHRSERDLIISEFETEHSDGSFTCVFFTCDGRIPPILFRTMRREQLLGKRILVAIDSWPADSRFPLGHYVETMGDAGLKDVETEVLLYEHNIPCDPFPAKVCRGNARNFFIGLRISISLNVVFFRCLPAYHLRTTKLNSNLEDWIYGTYRFYP
jgi:exosome complex exonuclease DIS3/RRP44